MESGVFVELHPSRAEHNMRAVVADDDPETCQTLVRVLQHWGCRVETCADGYTTWQLLAETSTPTLVMLNWSLPGLAGGQICQRLRQGPGSLLTYVIVLTTRGEPEEAVAGLHAGADDYLSKPFEPQELLARLQVGIRVLSLQQALHERLHALEDAVTRESQLRGLLPICAYCKKIRDHHNGWEQLERFISERSEAEFTHSICPDCYTLFVRPQLEHLLSLRRTAP